MDGENSLVDMRQRLAELFDSPATTSARLFNLVLVLLILSSVGASMIGTEPGLSPLQCDMICYSEYFFAVIFLVEYLLRLYAASDRMGYVFSVYGVIDLIAILPALLISMNGNSLALRLARMVSLLRLLKIVRHSGDLMLLLIAMRESVRLLVLVALAVLGLAVIGGNLMYFVEPDNFKSAFEGVWWSLVTMSTVGYGDFVPHTSLGKILAGIGMFLGIGVFAIITAVIGAKIHELTERRHIRCNTCRDVIPITSRFCMHCGETVPLEPAARELID